MAIKGEKKTNSPEKNASVNRLLWFQGIFFFSSQSKITRSRFMLSVPMWMLGLNHIHLSAPRELIDGPATLLCILTSSETLTDNMGRNIPHLTVADGL